MSESKDLFLIDTRCRINEAIERVLKEEGFGVKVAKGFHGVPDEVLKQAEGYTAVCLFVNKKISDGQVEILKSNGNKLVLCCSAGFDNAPVEACKAAGIRVARVPTYSPSSIAEYAVATIFALSKNLRRNCDRTRKADFSLDGLQCILLEGKTVGVIGTGGIGQKVAEKLSALVGKVVCYDAFPNHEWIKQLPNGAYMDTVDELLAVSHFITIHIPLMPETKHLINKDSFKKMKDGVIIVNTSRGEIINTHDLVEAIKSGKVSGAGLDVFEGEKEFIFKNMTQFGFDKFPDLEELTGRGNVILSGHVAFYTDESVHQIAAKTLENYESFIGKRPIDEKAFVV